ncbi:hypothetical protein ACFPRL_18680 [Pseudoclavibacter helvolus]
MRWSWESFRTCASRRVRRRADARGQPAGPAPRIHFGSYATSSVSW